MTHVAARALLVTLSVMLVALLGCRRDADARKRHESKSPLPPLTSLVQAQAPQPTEPPGRPPNAGTDCLATALNVLYLVDQTAYALCVGAGSDAPAQCFGAARERTVLLDDQIVGLCRCAGSADPVDCFDQVRRQGILTDDRIIAMCSAVVTQQLTPGDCAVRSSW